MRTVRLLALGVFVLSACSTPSTPPTSAPDPNPPARVARFFHTDLAFPTTEEIAAARTGQTVLLTFKDDPQVIVSGAADDALRTALAPMTAAGSDWLLGYWHEPESDLTPAEYRAAFVHVADLAKGAAHVRTVMVLQASTFAGGRADAWYPGDDVVDVVGVDGYDWKGCRTHGGVAAPGASSASFARIFGSAEAFAQTHDKPVVVGEFATAADPTRPWARAGWLREAAAWMGEHPAFIGAAYFNHGTAGGFRCQWALSAEQRRVYESLWTVERR